MLSWLLPGFQIEGLRPHPCQGGCQGGDKATGRIRAGAGQSWTVGQRGEMGRNLGEAWTRLRGWRGRCLQPPSGAQQVCLDSSRGWAAHITSRQGCRLVSLLFQQAFMLYRLCQEWCHQRHRRNLPTDPQFPLLPGITTASRLRKLCQLLLPEGEVGISAHSWAWTVTLFGPALLTRSAFASEIPQEAPLPSGHV